MGCQATLKWNSTSEKEDLQACEKVIQRLSNAQKPTPGIESTYKLVSSLISSHAHCSYPSHHQPHSSSLHSKHLYSFLVS